MTQSRQLATTNVAATARSGRGSFRAAVTPRDVLFVLFRNKRKALACFAALAASAVAIALAMPDVYRSEARMLVRLGRESVVMDPTASVGQTVQPIQTRESEINGELELLKSRELAEQVVARVGAGRILDGGQGKFGAGQVRADADAAAFADALLRLREEADVAVVPDSNVLYVAYRDSDPDRAREVVEAFVAGFLDLRLRVYRNPDSQAFFAEQHRRALAELDVLQSEVRAIKDRTGLADLTTQRTILLTRIGELQRDVGGAGAALAGAEATINQVRASLGTVPRQVVTSRTTSAPNSSVEALRQTLNDLKLEERDITSRYVETSPVVQAIRAKVQQAEGMLADAEANAQETTGLNATYETLALRLETETANAAAERAKLARLEADLTAARGGLAALNSAQVTLDDLQRQVAVAEENVRSYAKTHEETRIGQALEADKISNISLVQPAKLPLEPEGPRRKLLMLVGLFLAGVASVTLAFVAEALDHTVKRPEDLRAAGVRPEIVVSVPRLTSGAAVAKRLSNYFDDLGGGLRYAFGPRRRMTRVAATGASRGMFRATVTGAAGVLAWPVLAIGHAVVSFAAYAVGNAGAAATALARAALSPLTSERAPAMQTAGGHVLDDEHDWMIDAESGPAMPSRSPGGRSVTGDFDADIVAEHEALQDLDDDERPTVEPKAAPDRTLAHTLRLLAYGARRDAAGWWWRDARPNLQLSDRMHRAAAAETIWSCAHDLVEGLLLETDDAHTGSAPATIAVIGGRRGSGTSTVAAHLAGVIAERVRLEAAATRGSAALEEDPRRGAVLLLEVSRGEARPGALDPDTHVVAVTTPVEGLLRASLPTLQTNLVLKAIELARQSYRHVVLDLPPVFADVAGGRGGFAQSREEAGPRLAGLCDAAVVVVEAGSLRREAAGRCFDRVTRANVQVAAIVLNKREYPVPHWLYQRV